MINGQGCLREEFKTFSSIRRIFEKYCIERISDFTHSYKKNANTMIKLFLYFFHPTSTF